MSMKKNLLAIVKEILSDSDSEEINSIADSTEAKQVAEIVQTTFYNLVAVREIPEHEELIKLTPASDSEFPTHFEYTDNVKEITDLWYENGDGFYSEIRWCEPLDFLSRTDRITENYDTVYDKHGGTKLRIKNDANPTFYTSFDDQWIVMNSYDSGIDSTLQHSKVRAYGTVYPVFVIADTYVPDLDATMFPYLIAEAKSTAMSLLKGQSDPKVEQAARRQKSYNQNDKEKTKRGNKRVDYGRN